MYKLNIGSTVFFEKLSNYVQHDYDILLILDEYPDETGSTHFSSRSGEYDIFCVKQMSKDEFIKDVLNNNRAVYVCHFLVPEFASLLNLTIEDLKQVEQIIYKLKDTRHSWYIKIYEAYIANNDFFLTDTQLNEAFEEYKKYRLHRYLK